MNEKEIMWRYSKYFDYIKRLSKYELWETPSLTKLKVRRAAIQSCYREIKESEFRGTIIDYLCLVSTNVVLNDWGKFLKLGKSEEENEKWLCHFIYSDYDVVKNMLRLFSKDTSYVFESYVFQIYAPDDTIERRFHFFQLLNLMRFAIEQKLTEKKLFKLVDSIA